MVFYMGRILIFNEQKMLGKISILLYKIEALLNLFFSNQRKILVLDFSFAIFTFLKSIFVFVPNKLLFHIHPHRFI